MTRRIIHTLRALATTPAWAPHFHADGSNGGSTACFDQRCAQPPLSTD
jgi:hypothetical protein